MRLFVAVELERSTQIRVEEIMKGLNAHIPSAKFTRRENLHVTLAFLGETENVEDARRALNAVEAEPFFFLLQGLGRFAHSSICWMGVAEDGALQALHRKVNRALAAGGFPVEHRGFHPHLTLARRACITAEQLERMSGSAGPLRVQVNRVALMRSHRPGGVLVYTPIHHSPLV